MNRLVLQSADEVALEFVTWKPSSLPRELCDLQPLRAAWARSENGYVRDMASKVEDRDPLVTVQAARSRFDEAAARLTSAKQPTDGVAACGSVLAHGGQLLLRDSFGDGAVSAIGSVAEHVADYAIRGLEPRRSPFSRAPSAGFLLTSFTNFYPSIFLVGLTRVNPGAFVRLMDVLMTEIADRAAKYRRSWATKDNDHQPFRPANFEGVLAALSLAPSLSPACEAALKKLAGARGVTPMALFTLARHGHASSIERLTTSADLEAVRAVLDVEQDDMSALFFAGPAGAQHLRESMLNPKVPWHARAVEAAVALGVWDANAQRALVEAIERDDGLARLAPVQSIEFEEDLRQRVTKAMNTKLLPAPKNATVPEAIEFFSHFEKCRTWGVAIPRARRLAAHFDAVRAASPRSLWMNVLMELASVPESPAGIDETWHWAHIARQLEARWVPERANELTPKDKPKRKRRS